MKKGLSILLIIALMAVVALTACSSNDSKGSSNSNNSNKSNNSQSSNGGDSGKSSFKVGMITDAAGVNDNSYNQYAWEGLQKLKNDTSAEIKYLEGKSDADNEPNLNQFVQQKFDLVWGLSFSMDDAVRNVAVANKDRHFGVIDSDLGGDIPNNVISVTHKEEEGSFLVGVIAGLTTKSNKIGFLGGIDFATINKFEYGFKAGVKAVNPNAKVTSVYVGSFVAPDLGKQHSATLYDQGVDIIYHAAGSTGVGLFNEAKERKAAGQNVWVIGVDSDQSIVYGSDITLTSMMKYTNNSIYFMSKKAMDGEFNGGTTTVLGLAEDAVGIAPTSDVNVPKDVLDKVEQFRQQIIDKTFDVPKNKEEFEKFNLPN